MQGQGVVHVRVSRTQGGVTLECKTDVQVQLTGEDGNAFAIIGRVSKALKRAGYRELATEWVSRATSCKSYDGVLQLVFEYVDPL